MGLLVAPKDTCNEGPAHIETLKSNGSRIHQIWPPNSSCSPIPLPLCPKLSPFSPGYFQLSLPYKMATEHSIDFFFIKSSLVEKLCLKLCLILQVGRRKGTSSVSVRPLTRSFRWLDQKSYVQNFSFFLWKYPDNYLKKIFSDLKIFFFSVYNEDLWTKSYENCFEFEDIHVMCAFNF